VGETLLDLIRLHVRETLHARRAASGDVTARPAIHHDTELQRRRNAAGHPGRVRAPVSGERPLAAAAVGHKPRHRACPPHDPPRGITLLLQDALKVAQPLHYPPAHCSIPAVALQLLHVVG